MAADGFWTVQFQGTNGAVVVLTKGKIFGGDSGYTFTGSYEGDSNIKARVLVQNFVPGVPNVLGQHGNFELEFRGTVSGDTMNVTANLVGQPGQTMTARLTRKSALP